MALCATVQWSAYLVMQLANEDPCAVCRALACLGPTRPWLWLRVSSHLLYLNIHLINQPGTCFTSFL